MSKSTNPGANRVPCSDDFNDAVYWPSCARKMRGAVVDIKDLGTKELGATIADHYDRLARGAEKRVREEKIGKTPMFKREVVLHGRRTSIALESKFWRDLGEIAADKNKAVSQLVEQIDHERDNVNLSLAVRLFVLNHLRKSLRQPGGGVSDDVRHA